MQLPDVITKNKFWFILGSLIVGLILFWGALHAYNVRRKNIEIEQTGANVNAALQKVIDAKTAVDKDKPNEASSVQEFKDATNQYLDAVNASEPARVETNKAIANVEKARNASAPVNTSADDFHRILDEVDKQQ